MNRWYQIRRLRGAAYLILVGVLALLNQWRILSWDRSWPLFLIMAGVISLAERAAWTADVQDQQAAQAYGQPLPGQPVPPSPPSPSYWHTPPPPTHPPAPENLSSLESPRRPEDTGRPEDRDREDR
jgi:hypothetical protein